MAAVGLAVRGGIFLAGTAATILALVVLVLVKPVKNRLFMNRRARFVTLIIDHDTSLAELKAEIEATNLHPDRIVIRPGLNPNKDSAELVLSKGSSEVDLLSLTDNLRRVSGIYEINSPLDSTYEPRNRSS